MNSTKKRICFVGNMLGRNTGFVTTQGQIVADLFARENDYEITSVSSRINRLGRLTEIIWILIKNKRKFDAVVLEVYSGLSFVIAETTSFLCKILGLPLVMVLHGGNLPEFAETHPNWTRRVFRRANFLVAPSGFLAEKIGKLGFTIRVIPNVLDLENYRFRERSNIEPNLIWMRSFHPLYNPEMAIEVFARIRERYRAATLVMAGKDKGLENEIRSKVDSLNLSSAVRFAGFLDETNKAKEFSAADVYINTNRVDNMPVSVIEAGAYGLPIVSTDVGGLSFLIDDGENGLLSSSEDATAMSDAIFSLLENPELTRKISRGGRRLAERSAWREVKAHWEKLFDEIRLEKLKSRSKKFSKSNLEIESVQSR